MVQSKEQWDKWYKANRVRILEKMAAHRRTANIDREVWAKYLWKELGRRARKKKVRFNLKIEDLVIPNFCPVLGIELTRGSVSPSDATVDRIRPELGYTRGNILIVSRLANDIKSAATPDQIIEVGNFYRELTRQR